jgi:predicted porin
VQVANGSAIADDGGQNVLHPDNTSDENHNKALGLHVDFTPARLRAWTLGASLYQHRVVSEGLLAPVDVVQMVVAADLTKRSGVFELTSEYFLLRDRDRLGVEGTTTNHLYYVQVGYEFRDRLTPYARHEQMSLNESDSYTQALGANDTRIETAGLRIRLGEPSVLKFEGRFVDTNGTDHHQEYAAQWAFTF